jgi:hypothetical protein
MLAIQIRGRVILLKPCPFFYFQQCEFYSGQLEGFGLGDIAANDGLWSILQALINLHPRGDRHGFGFELPRDNWQDLADLLDGLKNLNKVDPVPPAPKPKNYLELSPQSSGDLSIDLLADLSNIYGYDSARQIIREQSLDSINKLIARHNEITRPREDRANEEMTKDLKKWAAEDESFWSDLGL